MRDKKFQFLKRNFPSVPDLRLTLPRRFPSHRFFEISIFRVDLTLKNSQYIITFLKGIVTESENLARTIKIQRK